MDVAVGAMMQLVEVGAGPSRTALMTAIARALHREEPAPWVLDDRFAVAVAGEAGQAVRDRLLAQLPPDALRSFSRWCCVRSRVAEDVVEHELTTNDVRQYVVLGAGLDTFALRRPDLLRNLRVFEVDHPASQGWKRARLEALHLDAGPNLTYSPIDFERQRLDEGLRDAGFDFDSPAVFSWIGVTMFLTPAAIGDTLDSIRRCAEGTRVVLTYNQPQTALLGLGAETQAALTRIVDDMSEPMVTFFTPPEIEALLRVHGFADFVHVGPDEARSSYFAGRSDVVLGGAQRLISGTVRRAREPSRRP